MIERNLYVQVADERAALADELEAELATFRQIARRFKGGESKSEALIIIERLIREKEDLLCQKGYYLNIGSKLGGLLKQTEAEGSRNSQPA